MNIIEHKYIFLIFSAFLVLVSLASLFLWGLKSGIDFTGGSLLEIEFTEIRPSNAEIQKAALEINLSNVTIQPVDERGLLLRFRELEETEHQNLLQALQNLAAKGDYGSVLEKQFTAIGPTVGKEMKSRSILAVVLALIGIVLYIAFAFRKVSKPVSSWKYGIAAIIALVHDVTTPLGVFAFLGHFKGVEIDTLFITALLTVLGFSVHDTIVVFDRIRENLRRQKTNEPFASTVNRSINETISRSINTSLTVLLVLLAVFFFGGETVKYFSLVLIIGILFGTYSSIFIASPLLVIWNGISAKKKS